MFTIISEIYFRRKNGRVAGWYFLLMLVFLYAGSNSLANDYTPSGKTKSSYVWDLQKYTALLKQNMENTDKRYSKEYIFYDFIVDTDYGSTLIQNLIDPSAVSFIIDQLEIRNLDYNVKLLKIYDRRNNV